MKFSNLFYMKILMLSILLYLTSIACSCEDIYIGNCCDGIPCDFLGKSNSVSLNDIGQTHNGNYIGVNDSGEIYTTAFTNEGQLSASLLYSVPGNLPLIDIEYLSTSSINIIVGSSGTILRNTSLNPEWVKVTSPVNEDLNKIYAESEDVIYIAGNAGTILKSIDKGLSWEQLNLNSPSIENLIDINGNQNAVFVSGDNYTFYKSTDGGETWNPTGLKKHSSNASQFGYNRIYFYDDNLGFVGGPHGLILKTTDSGVSWFSKVAQGFDEITDLFFISPESGGAVGPNGTIRFTTDGGDSWFEDTSATSYLSGREVKRIVPFGKNYGTILGSDGLSIFIAPDSTYLDSLVITSASENYQIITEYKLYQNYPNPFNPTTKISWQSPVSNRQTLKIFDVLGNEIATLVDEDKPAGSYTIEFDASKLSSGIYFYQLSVGDVSAGSAQSFRDTKKLVLLR